METTGSVEGETRPVDAVLKRRPWLGVACPRCGAVVLEPCTPYSPRFDGERVGGCSPHRERRALVVQS